jgi:hypothetical protein
VEVAYTETGETGAEAETARESALMTDALGVGLSSLESREFLPGLTRYHRLYGSVSSIRGMNWSRYTFAGLELDVTRK